MKSKESGASTSGAHLYVIQSEAGYLKIGRSNTPRKRRLALQGASAEQLKLIKVLRDRGHEERRVHDKMAQWRRKGEWFHDTAECRGCLCAELGVEIRFLRKGEEDSDERHPRTPIEIAIHNYGVEIRQKAQRERASRVAAGLTAYRAGRAISNNPYRGRVSKLAWEEGWRSGCAQDAE